MYLIYICQKIFVGMCLNKCHSHVIDGKERTTLHPITYVSSLFRGSQLNWAALTKDTYVIYMSVQEMLLYLYAADITLRSNHLPLRRFLEKNTLNSTVNN